MTQICVLAAAYVAAFVALQEASDDTVDHRSKPRKKRKKYDPRGALACIVRDYIGPDALHGADFPLQFRISKSRFECLMQDVMQKQISFYVQSKNTEHLLEARLLLPLKCLAYGVPPHAFVDYFSMSKQLARTCCKEFDKTIIKMYTKEYLRLPHCQLYL